MRGGGIRWSGLKVWLTAIVIAVAVDGCSSYDKFGHKFLTKGIENGLAEISLCKLALSRSENEEIKNFARRVVADRSDINRELVLLAQEKGLTAPTEPTRKQKYAVNHLASLSGASFDRDFVKYSVTNHETDVQDFRRQAEIGSDQEIRNAAARGLKMLQTHLSLARELAEKMRPSH